MENRIYVIIRVEPNREASLLPGLYSTKDAAENDRAHLAKHDIDNRVFFVDYIVLGGSV